MTLNSFWKQHVVSESKWWIRANLDAVWALAAKLSMTLSIWPAIPSYLNTPTLTAFLHSLRWHFGKLKHISTFRPMNLNELKCFVCLFIFLAQEWRNSESPRQCGTGGNGLAWRGLREGCILISWVLGIQRLWLPSQNLTQLSHWEPDSSVIRNYGTLASYLGSVASSVLARLPPAKRKNKSFSRSMLSRGTGNCWTFGFIRFNESIRKQRPNNSVNDPKFGVGFFLVGEDFGDNVRPFIPRLRLFIYLFFLKWRLVGAH